LNFKLETSSHERKELALLCQGLRIFRFHGPSCW